MPKEMMVAGTPEIPQKDEKDDSRNLHTHPMKIHNNPTLPIPPQQLRPDRSLQPIHNLPHTSTLHKLFLILKIDIEREHVPAKQLLAITRIEPEGLDLAFYNTSSVHPN